MNLSSMIRTLPRSSLAFLMARAIMSFGSTVTYFALDVWIYKQTGSYALFATVAVLTALPGIILAPIAGALVDRHPGKRLLILCDAATAGVVLTLCVGAAKGNLSTLHVGTVAVLLSALRTFAWPAAWSNLTLITPPARRPRVNGIAEAVEGATPIVAPVLGAWLIEVSALSYVFVIDIAATLTCIATMSLIRLPAARSSTPDAQDDPPSSSLLKDCIFGFRWIAARRDLRRLLMFFMAINLGSSIYVVAFTPYLLSFEGPGQLGSAMAAGAAGIVIGGLLFGATGGFKRHEWGVLFGASLSGTCMLLSGLTRSPHALIALAFVLGLSSPLTNASSQTIWQSRTPQEILGRVFSIRRMIAWCLNPLAILLSIPMSSWLFEPLLKQGPAQWQLEQLWGGGQVGVLGLMISTCGLLCLSITIPLLAFDGLRVHSPALEAGELTGRSQV